MEDPYLPLYQFLRSSPVPNIPCSYKLLRVMDFDDDVNLYTRVEKEWSYTWCDQWWEDWQRISQECEEKARWHKEAQRQVYVQDAKKQLQVKPKDVHEMKMVALTVNPPPEYQTVEHLQQFVDIIKTVSAVKSGCYVFEQRSIIGEQTHGWHLHFSINTTYAPSKLKQFVSQKMLSRGFKLAYYATHDDGGFRDKYMQGVKNHASKDPKVLKDISERDNYNLQHFYEF